MKSGQAQSMGMSPSILDKLKPIELQPLPDNPQVSVLIANYNYGQYIGEAIGSVLNQTYQNFEIVICDDGSTDNSVEAIRRYAERDSRIKYIAKENGGHASALNAAFEISSGSVVAILDADDLYLPQKLERIVYAFASNSQMGFVGHPVKVVSIDGKVLKDIHGRRLSQGWLAPGIIQGQKAILPPASGIALRREVAEICFPLPLVFRSLADCALRERAALVTVCNVIPEALSLYRQHGRNVTGAAGVTSLAQIEKALQQVKLILQDRKSFIEKVHGAEVDSNILELWELVETAGLMCAKALLAGEDICPKMLASLSNKRQRYIWRTLFTLPRPVRKGLFKLWWGEWKGKRLVRNLLPINDW